MADFSNIPTGLKITTQIPLNVKEFCKDEDTLAYLGVDDNLAFTYHDQLEVLCLAEKSIYIWREVQVGEENTGLVPLDFTYPYNHSAFGINYSNKSFNFFKTKNDFEIVNVGTGAKVYKDSTVVGNNTQFNLKKLRSNGGTVLITELTNEINFEIGPVTTDINITAGANVIVTEPTPNNFVISSTDNIVLLENSTTTTVTGNGTLGNEYQVDVNNLQKVVNTFPYTLLNSDDKYTIFLENGASNVVINVPDTLPSNFSVAFVQKGTGDVTITPTGTSVINSALGYKIKGQYYWALLEKELNTVTYYLIGNTKL